MAAARGPPRRAQPARAPDRGWRGHGAALPARRAAHRPGAPERADLQERRAEPQLRPGEDLTAGAGSAAQLGEVLRRGREALHRLDDPDPASGDAVVVPL